MTQNEQASNVVLHGYFRSTAAWRVRIALNLKGITYADAFHHLRKGEQRLPTFLTLNPQGLLPAFVLDDGRVLTQSLAICEFLDETVAHAPLLPADRFDRARVRAFAQVIACDVHPVQNLKVLGRLRALGLGEEEVTGWARAVIEEGLDACESLLLEDASHRFCFSDRPGLADLCLVPQLANARRFSASLRWPRLLAIEAQCRDLGAFARAEPEQQPDAE